MASLVNIMKSKSRLSFGYISFFNLFCKMQTFKAMRCIDKFICCCCQCFRVTKHSSMTARKHKRQQNAQVKLNQEIDLVEIVKTLRQARFLISNMLTPQQRQLVDFFKSYSLETKWIHKNKTFSKGELIQHFNDRLDDGQKARMDQQIVNNILIRRAKNVTYLDASNINESSSDEDHDSAVFAQEANSMESSVVETRNQMPGGANLRASTLQMGNKEELNGIDISQKPSFKPASRSLSQKPKFKSHLTSINNQLDEDEVIL